MKASLARLSVSLRFFPLLAVALLCACSSILIGQPEGAVKVTAEGSGSGESSSLDAARRQALQSLFSLYLSTAEAAANSAALESKILSRSGDFILREREVSREVLPGEVRRRLQFWVKLSSLDGALDAAGLLKPAGVRGRPKVALALRETADAAPEAAGRASAKLLTELIDRGYDAVDLTAQAPGRRVELSRADALSRSRALGAAYVLVGAASATPTGDPRLAGLASFRVRLAAELLSPTTSQPSAGAIEQEAEAVDLSTEPAAAKALEDAGLMGGDKAKTLLSGYFVERNELALIVDDIGGLDQIRHLIAALRLQPGIVAVSLSAIVGRDVKLRVFVERLGTDDLAARMLKLPGYSLSVRSVEEDYATVEVEQSGAAPGGQG